MNSPVDELINSYQLANSERDPAAKFCCLITIDQHNHPASRMLTVRTVSEQGITLYVDAHSPKIAQLQQNPRFELLFFWPTLMRQFKIRGHHQLINSPEQAQEWTNKPYPGRVVDLYHTKVRRQSSPIESRETLRREALELKQQHPEPQLNEIPEGLITLKIKPNRIKVWVNDQQDRLHDRREYHLIDGCWRKQVLVP